MKYSCEFLYVSFNLSSQVKRNIFSPSSQEYPSCVNIVDGFSHDAPERLLHPEPSIIDRLVWRTCLPREARLRPWPPDQRRGEPPGALGHCQREDDRLKSRTPQSRRHYGIAIWWVLWPLWLPQPFCATDSRVERRDLGRRSTKKNVFFRALPKLPNPPPLTPIWATWSFFWDIKIQDLKVTWKNVGRGGRHINNLKNS